MAFAARQPLALTKAATSESDFFVKRGEALNLKGVGQTRSRRSGLLRHATLMNFVDKEN
jgi:hypothetical protein